jgi:2-C-methyl-D-erythritol 4-phosphate cytidylyltransferase
MSVVKKEYLLLGSLSVLATAVHAFAQIPSVEVIVIVIPENGEADARGALPAEIFVSGKPKINFVTGGETRQASVFKALSFLAGNNSCGDTTVRYVLIHDGARPWVNPSLIEDVIKAAKNYGAVIPLLPMTDTPKECNTAWELQPEAFIARHLKRANTGLAQTPQGFKFPEIFHAHEKAALESEEFTDDAEVWGKFCGQVAVVPGDPKNRKITYREDIV